MNPIDTIAQVHDLLNHPMRLGPHSATYSRKDIERALHLMVLAAREAGADVVTEHAEHKHALAESGLASLRSNGL